MAYAGTDRGGRGRAGQHARRDGTGETSPRLRNARAADPLAAALLDRLLAAAAPALAQMFSDGLFVFTLRGSRGPDGGWQLRPAGTSVRYTAITALGLSRLTVDEQRRVLAGSTCHELITGLASGLRGMAGLGDVALLCWAAAEAGHPALPDLLGRLTELSRSQPTGFTVDAAWQLSALVAARPHLDVEDQLSAARARLLSARGPVLYPHSSAGSPWYRAHVGSFADQVYPLQALARLHASSGDAEALTVATTIAAAICAAQGEAGQWWWHYDCRTGGVVEGYPVYSVHQHAMAPMALLDLAEAGGPDHADAICRGLRWLAEPTESVEPLVPDDLPVTWRKVARNDRRKLVRGVRAAATSARPSLRLRVLDRGFPPGTVDHECRPYEFGWLLWTWLP